MMLSLYRRTGTTACRAVAATLIWLLTLAPAGAQPDPRPLLKNCMHHARELPADAILSLPGECPGLLEALAAGGYLDALVPPQADEITAGRLWDIHDFLITPEPALAPRLHADHAAIERILSEFRDPPKTTEPSWTERFLAWLDEKLGDRAEPQLAWVEQLVEALKRYQDVFAMFAYGTLLLLAAMLVWLLIRVIPFKRWRALTRGQSAPPRTTQQPAQRLDLNAVKALPAALQAPALLAYVLQELVASGRLPPDRSLTNREFGHALEQRERSAGRMFQQLSRFVDRQLYGGRQLQADELETCFEAAIRLTTGNARRAAADA